MNLKSVIPIAPMTICDDLSIISECGYQRELVSAYINCQARFNYLQFELSKCFKMHDGKCTPLYLDNWKSQEVQDIWENLISRNLHWIVKN